MAWFYSHCEVPFEVISTALLLGLNSYNWGEPERATHVHVVDHSITAVNCMCHAFQCLDYVRTYVHPTKLQSVLTIT